MIVFLAFFMFTSISLHAQTTPEFETIIFGATYGDGLVVSGSGSLSYENTRVDSLGYRAEEYNRKMLSKVTPENEIVLFNHEKVELDFSFENIKVWCKEKSTRKKPSDEFYIQNWEWAFNGEKLDLLRYDGLGEGNLILPAASIRAENDMPLEKFDPRYYGLQVMGESVSSFLQGSLGSDKVSNIQFIGEEVVDDMTCDVIQGTIQSTAEIIRVWLAPEYMYRPKRIEIQGVEKRTEINNTFKHYSNDVWFPALVRKNIFYTSTVTGIEKMYSEETLSVTKDFILNDDEKLSQVFEIEFPVGLNVYDFRTGERIEIK